MLLKKFIITRKNKMKFSGNGLYIEEYIKCQNCGYLIYETEFNKTIKNNEEKIFCSKWCLDWFNSDDKDSLV